jgi:anthranilate synthase component 1
LIADATGVCWLGHPPDGLDVTGDDPVTAVRTAIEALRGAGHPDLPPLTGGLVGFLSYDVVRRLERLPELTEDDLGVPELGLMLATDLVVLDHYTGEAVLVANVLVPPDPEARIPAYHQAIGRLDAMTTALSRPTPPLVSTVDHPVGRPRHSSRTEDGGYPKAVEIAKEAIRAGECFQIVVSQRFARPTTADPLDVYRVLRTTNPSPYMYLLRFDGFDIVGSSPEAHLKVTGNRALLHPIAGTRPRGATPEQDARLATELLADPKERAEHVMLVDLGRNDLGRVCRPGTVDVPEFMTIERYSHVMHIVSTVVGELTADRSAFDALAATFPAGTLSGAPKVRAMEIIEELEPTRRGLYGGTVGYFGFGGDLDMAIAIRTALIRDGIAYVQAGAGIVADSDPAAEERETRDKAAAVLTAIAAAETLRPAR